jgi:tryptophanyl-tRNA synthetase
LFKYLSGVKPTGELHIGNYVSIIKPVIDKGIKDDTLFLIADNHALAQQDKITHTREIYNTLRTFGMDHIIIQSQVPEIMELNWILSCFTAKGLLNRAHAYKSCVSTNIENKEDADKGVFCGLYTYPILMTADLAMFDTEYVFVGKDQNQHIEIAKEVIKKFNYINKTNLLNVPKQLEDQSPTVIGNDGRKMSKSYNNTLPLMCLEEELRKYVFKIKTNNKLDGESKEYNETYLGTLFDVFFHDKQYMVNQLHRMCDTGQSWKDIKEFVFDCINIHLKLNKCKYNVSIEQTDKVKEQIKQVKKKVKVLKKMIYN